MKTAAKRVKAYVLIETAAGKAKAVKKSLAGIKGSPAAWCNTLGDLDFMRVPLPAARTTTWVADMC